MRPCWDAGSFAEIGGEITARSTDFNLRERKTPSDGVITGYGLIDGNLVFVYSQDPDVLNGSMGEMHAKKIGNIYDMAMKMGAPVIGLIDCAGFRLQEVHGTLLTLSAVCTADRPKPPVLSPRLLPFSVRAEAEWQW